MNEYLINLRSYVDQITSVVKWASSGTRPNFLMEKLRKTKENGWKNNCFSKFFLEYWAKFLLEWLIKKLWEFFQDGLRRLGFWETGINLSWHYWKGVHFFYLKYEFFDSLCQFPVKKKSFAIFSTLMQFLYDDSKSINVENFGSNNKSYLKKIISFRNQHKIDSQCTQKNTQKGGMLLSETSTSKSMFFDLHEFVFDVNCSKKPKMHPKRRFDWKFWIRYRKYNFVLNFFYSGICLWGDSSPKNRTCLSKVGGVEDQKSTF